MAASKTLTREQRIERARKAGKASHSNENHIKALLRSREPLTARQIADLRDILLGAGNGAAA